MAAIVVTLANDAAPEGDMRHLLNTLRTGSLPPDDLRHLINRIRSRKTGDRSRLVVRKRAFKVKQS